MGNWTLVEALSPGKPVKNPKVVVEIGEEVE
jgi:hypothetical protein